jgi:hypothetical protein
MNLTKTVQVIQRLHMRGGGGNEKYKISLKITH